MVAVGSDGNSVKKDDSKEPAEKKTAADGRAKEDQDVVPLRLVLIFFSTCHITEWMNVLIFSLYSDENLMIK